MGLQVHKIVCVIIRLAGTPAETRGTKEVYFLKTVNYTKAKRN